MLAQRTRSLARLQLQLQQHQQPLGNLTIRAMSSATSSQTPITDAIKKKIQDDLKPTKLTVMNESHLHSHHAPMQGVTSKETHFRLNIVSERFDSMNRIQRHRHVYALLDKELKMDNGIHALALIAKTPAEDTKE